MSTQVKVTSLPNCDLCGKTAKYDAKTVLRVGTWANLCQQDFETFGVGLGTGKGQELVLE